MLVKVVCNYRRTDDLNPGACVATRFFQFQSTSVFFGCAFLRGYFTIGIWQRKDWVVLLYRGLGRPKNATIRGPKNVELEKRFVLNVNYQFADIVPWGQFADIGSCSSSSRRRMLYGLAAPSPEVGLIAC